MQSQIIIVASTNPVKIAAAHAGFAAMFPHERFEVRGVEVPSGVGHQPVGDDETLLGARTRALNARELIPGADYHIGIEGGVEHHGDDLIAMAWIVVYGHGRSGKAKTASFILPREVSELVNQGIELGEADDRVFGRSNSKHANGSVGILTDDVITRETFYSHAVVLALIPFKKTDLSFSKMSDNEA